MNDKIIAKRLCDGDEKAIGLVIEKYSRYVRKVAYNFSRGLLSDEDIDDIVIDAFSSFGRLAATLTQT